MLPMLYFPCYLFWELGANLRSSYLSTKLLPVNQLKLKIVEINNQRPSSLVLNVTYYMHQPLLTVSFNSYVESYHSSQLSAKAQPLLE
jgi:hypothetical protein